MTYRRFLRLSVAFVVAATLSACATTRQRFPEFTEVAKTQSTVPVVVDLVVYRDIRGSSRGYNPNVNEELMQVASTEIVKILEQRGFSPTILTTLDGLMYEPEPKADYVFSQDWKSTGEPYTGPALDQGENPWLTSQNRIYFKTLFKTAREVNLSRQHDQAFAEEKVIQKAIEKGLEPAARLSELTLDPQLFADLDTDVVMLVRAHGRLQTLAKFLTKGVLVGATTSALTGGIWLIPAGSYAHVEVIVFDTKKEKILWYNDRLAEGRHGIKSALRSTMSAYPYSDGRSHRAHERDRISQLGR